MSGDLEHVRSLAHEINALAAQIAIRAEERTIRLLLRMHQRVGSAAPWPSGDETVGRHTSHQPVDAGVAAGGWGAPHDASQQQQYDTEHP